jgi:acetolactate synthase-1/2/3 large subunit
MEASHAFADAPEPDAARSGAEIVCDALQAHGVHTVFGYAGGAILHFYDALHRTPGLRHVVVRHEQAAAHAASGYARAGGGVGVCVATSGPGATNLLTGIMDAHLDSTPLVVLCGQVPVALLGRDAFQETDMLAMSAPVAKHGFQPRRVEEVEPMLHAAFHLATSGRPGPIIVDLPKDVLLATSTQHRPAPFPLPGYRLAPGPEPGAVAEAAALLAGAERPLLLVGGGALTAGAGPALQRLAERLGLPIVSTINAKGLVSERHPQVLGMIGMYGRKAAVHALRECDVLLAVGCRFTDRITGPPDAFARGKRIVHVDVDAYELGKNVPVAVAIQADGHQGAEAPPRPRSAAGRAASAPRAPSASAACRTRRRAVSTRGT